MLGVILSFRYEGCVSDLLSRRRHKALGVFGSRTFKEIESKALSREIFARRDAMSQSPQPADYAVQVCRLLLS